VGPNRTKKEKKKNGEEGGVQFVTGDRWNKVLLWTVFEDVRRDKVIFSNYCKINTESFKEMYVPINLSLQKEDANMKKCIPNR